MPSGQSRERLKREEREEEVVGGLTPMGEAVARGRRRRRTAGRVVAKSIFFSMEEKTGIAV